MKYFINRPILCRGEESGKCEDFYFEDGVWKLRYLVANDGGFVFKKRSLLTPEVIDRPELESNIPGIPLTVVSQQYSEAPEFNAERPFSREVEISALKHYNVAPYWMGTPDFNPAVGLERDESEAEGTPLPEQEETNLRSFKEVLGYEFRNKENVLGELVDMVLDIIDFQIAHLVVDTKPGDRGGLRLLSVSQEDNGIKIDYYNRRVVSSCSYYHLLESPSADLSDGRLSLGDQQKVNFDSF